VEVPLIEALYEDEEFQFHLTTLLEVFPNLFSMSFAK
jgi:hypothetical protein